MMTHSLCPTCYRHLEAEVFEHDGKIKIKRTCPAHGEIVGIVENDASFYHRIQQESHKEYQQVVILDVTDKCNLNCPHCYHIPNNHTKDKPIEKILEEVEQTPNGFSILLGGAEPACRPDICEVIKAVSVKRNVALLTNGIKFNEKDFALKVAEAGADGYPTLVGLNGPNYHDEKTHRKQLYGLENLRNLGMPPMVGYTAQYHELKDIVTEIVQLWGKSMFRMVRLRFGCNLGRHPDTPFRTLSDHCNEIRRVCGELGFSYVEFEIDNTLCHQMCLINGAPVRIIQWPDETNVVMADMCNGPWAKFVDPITDFCHQIILRDAFVNKRLPRLDTCPEQYVLTKTCAPTMVRDRITNL